MFAVIVRLLKRLDEWDRNRQIQKMREEARDEWMRDHAHEFEIPAAIREHMDRKR